jgi:hypothetical protein
MIPYRSENGISARADFSECAACIYLEQGRFRWNTEDSDEGDYCMTNGQKAAIGVSLLGVLLVAGRFAMIYKANHEEGPAPKDPYADRKVDPDELVFLKKERPDSLKDEKALTGRTLWVSAGGQMDYYVDKGNHVDYAHPVGTLLGAEQLLIKGAFEEKAPTSGPAVARIPGGEKHVLLAFTLPGSSDPNALYATPVGNFDGANYSLLNDQIFFYDDPHVLYKHWGPEMWAHIDKHEAVLGMNENQAMMSLGEVIKPDSDNTGDRDVSYENNGKPLTIQFVKNKAVKITPESSF